MKGALQKVQPTTSSTVDAVDTMEMDVDKKVAGLEAENAKLQESKDRMMELLKKQKNMVFKFQMVCFYMDLQVVGRPT